VNHIQTYVDAIQAGDAIVSRRVAKVYERLADEIRNPRGGFVFDERKAQRPIDFIEKFCRHSKGEWAGQPVKLELFQRAFIAALFGFVDGQTGLRRFREAMLYMARKNGKSTLLSGLALYMLIADKEPGAEVYAVASKKEQARIVFDECLHMVEQSPELSRILKKRKADLYCPLSMAKLQALGRNSDTLDGLNAHLVIVDELHSIKDRNVYEVMKQSQSARRQPLLVSITTAGTQRETIFDSLYAYASGVADGTIQDDAFLPVLYELDSKDEWTLPDAWAKANPGLGSIKKLDDLRGKVERAKNSPGELRGLLCKDFNIISTVNAAWLDYDSINNPETFDISGFRGACAIGGADLSITTDLTCATLLWMDAQEKRYVEQMYFLPEDGFAERCRDEKIPYAIWKERGLLRLCPGNTIKPTMITQWFIEMVKQRGIYVSMVYYDSYSARYWVDEMTAAGFKMIRCIQGFKTLSIPLERLGADLKARKINYNDNPLLKWCMCNVGVTEDRNGNLMPVKARNPKYRIDGFASLLDSYVGLCEHYNELKQMNAKIGRG